MHRDSSFSNKLKPSLIWEEGVIHTWTRELYHISHEYQLLHFKTNIQQCCQLQEANITIFKQFCLQSYETNLIKRSLHINYVNGLLTLPVKKLLFCLTSSISLLDCHHCSCFELWVHFYRMSKIKWAISTIFIAVHRPTTTAKCARVLIPRPLFRGSFNLYILVLCFYDFSHDSGGDFNGFFVQQLF